MFKEIVSKLSFSPAMVERLSTYARTTKQQQRLSGWSLVVLSVLFFAQIIIITLPPPATIIEQTASDTDEFISPLITEEPSNAPTVVAQFESFITELPKVTDMTSIMMYLGLIIINTFAYLSLRQRVKEMRIIRHQLNQGGI